MKLRLRRLTIAVLFAISTVAIAATTPNSTRIPVGRASTTIRLTADHPTALARIVVRFNAAVDSIHPSPYVYLLVEASEPGTGSTGTSDAARFVVMAATPYAAASPAPTVALEHDPTPSPWEADASTSRVTLPIDCGIGPCERAFWLIGQLIDPQAGAIDAEVQVDGFLGAGDYVPSDVRASVALDEPVLLAGDIPQFGASTPIETVSLGSKRPATARVVEISVGAPVTPRDRAAVANVSIDLTPDSDAHSVARRPSVAMYPLDERSEGSSAPVTDGFLPFADCTLGVNCTRHVLVTMAWTGEADVDQTFGWRFSVRRTDLRDYWTSVARMSARVVRRIDVASDRKPTTVHREGDASVSPFTAPSQVQLDVRAGTSSTDPLARLLPVPGSLTYRTRVVGGLPSAPTSNVVRTIIQPLSSPGTEAISSPDAFGSQVAGVFASPNGACRIGEACHRLEIGTHVGNGDPVPSPPLRFHWSVDLTVYSYDDLPVSLTVKDRSSKASSGT